MASVDLQASPLVSVSTDTSVLSTSMSEVANQCLRTDGYTFEIVLVWYLAANAWLDLLPADAKASDPDAETRTFFFCLMTKLMQSTYGNDSKQRIEQYTQILESHRQNAGKDKTLPQISKEWVQNVLSHRRPDIMRPMRQMEVERRFIKTGGKRHGGTTTTKRYVPVDGPYFFETEKPEQVPCGYVERLKRNDNEWWVTCERTSVAGTKKCKTYRVTPSKVELIPASCRVTTSESLKAVTVEERVETADNGTTKVVERRVIPDIETNMTVTRTLDESKRKELAFDDAPKTEELKDLIPAKQGGVGSLLKRQSPAIGSTKIGSIKRTPIPAIGSIRRTPSLARNEVSHQNHMHLLLANKEQSEKIRLADTELTDLDVPLLQAPIDTNGQRMLPEPASWTELRKQQKLQPGEFFAMEDTQNGRALDKGLKFGDRHLPAVSLRDEASLTYFNWLLGVLIRFRSEHPESCRFCPRARYVTIAELESMILASISSMETKKQKPNFEELFKFWPGRTVHPHPVLQKYRDNQNQSPYVSYLHMRDTLLPTQGSGAIPDNGEETANSALYTIIVAITNRQWLDGWKVDDGNPVRLPVDFDSSPFVEEETGRIETGLLENDLLGRLARIQELAGFAINFWHPEFNQDTRELYNPKAKRHLSEKLIEYIDTFGVPDDGAPLVIQLAAKRSKMIDQQIKSATEVRG